MRPSLILRATEARKPLIKFLGKRTAPKSIDHTPAPHPVSPTHQLPTSFSNYRQKASQHGPLVGSQKSSSSQSASSKENFSHALKATTSGGPMTYGAIGGTPANKLGSIKPKEGEFFDISELPSRFRRRGWTEEEIEAVTSGGASMW